MLIILFIIFLLIIIIGFKAYKKGSDNWESNLASLLEILGGIGICLGCIIEFIVVILIVDNCNNLAKLQVTDQKIAMYEEENNNIQNEITEIVANYKNYEQNTYSKSLDNIDFRNTNIVVLTQLYPDLKSNEMVNKQIQIYQDNKNKINALKEQKIDYQVSRWWLYFGN